MYSNALLVAAAAAATTTTTTTATTTAEGHAKVLLEVWGTTGVAVQYQEDKREHTISVGVAEEEGTEEEEVVAAKKRRATRFVVLDPLQCAALLYRISLDRIGPR
jgi:hypothetical protein